MRQLRVVFGPQLFHSTAIVMYTCFVLNVAYFGSLYAFPQVLPASSSMHESAALQLLIGAFWELPGQVAGVAICAFLPRILSIKLYLVLAASAFLSFTLSMRSYSNVAMAWMTIGYYGIKCFMSMGFVMVYQYSTEIYPTEARTTGSAMGIGSGRLAGILAPLLFEAIQSTSGGPMDFFYILFGFLVSNLFLAQFLSIETKGVALRDDVEDTEAEQCTKSITAGLPSPAKTSLEEAAPLLSPEVAPLVQEPFAPR
jgi:hypothetical protein